MSGRERPAQQGSSLRLQQVRSAVDDGHVPFVVPLADCRRELIEPLELYGIQLEPVRGGVLLYAGHPLGAGNWRDVVALRERPRDGDLSPTVTTLVCASETKWRKT